MEDHILIRGITNGNETSFATLYSKYVDVLFSYGVGLGYEREIIKDAIQDVFLKLLNHKFADSEISNLKFYLFRSLKNRLIDLHKNRIINDELDNCEFDFSIKVSVLDDIIEAENKKILEQRINKLLDSLTNRQREAIVLRYVHELEYDKIGALLDMTPKASRKLVSRAMERMRNQELLLLLILFCKF